MGRGRQLNLFFAGLAIKWRADWKRIYLRPWPKCPSAAIEWKEPPITAQNFRCRDNCKTRQVEEIWGIFCCLNFQFFFKIFSLIKSDYISSEISNNLIHLNWMKINEHTHTHGISIWMKLEFREKRPAVCQWLKAE